MTDWENQFVHNIVKQLNAGIDDLDLSLSSQLDNMRLQAIDSISIKTKTESEPALLHSIHDRLESDNEAVPVEIEKRLNEIRHQAMAKATQLQQKDNLGSLNIVQNNWETLIANLRSGPTAAIASACVAVVAVSLFFLAPATNEEVSISDEINLLASAEDIELYENLDFYLWLAENDISN